MAVTEHIEVRKFEDVMVRYTRRYHDGISGTAPDVSHIWAKQAVPFKNIVFRNVAVPALVECVNAEVTIDGGLFRKKPLSSKELQDRINNIENNKNLLY